jgi:small subunit ribosomal protein S16
VATKIKLMRLGKMRAPYYRVVIADSRTKRDGRSIETIGKYHPKEDPSFIEINGERAAYWLGVGAQPTEAVTALLKVTGDWQKFKGLPAPPPMLVKADKVDKKTTFEAAAKGGAEAEAAEAEKPAKKPKATKADKPAADAAAESPAGDTAESTDAPAAETAEPTEAPAADAAEVSTEAPATDASAEVAVDTASAENATDTQ